MFGRSACRWIKKLLQGAKISLGRRTVVVLWIMLGSVPVSVTLSLPAGGGHQA